MGMKCSWLGVPKPPLLLWLTILFQQQSLPLAQTSKAGNLIVYLLPVSCICVLIGPEHMLCTCALSEMLPGPHQHSPSPYVPKASYGKAHLPPCLRNMPDLCRGQAASSGNSP